MVFNKSASHVAGLNALRFHAKSTERFFFPSRSIGTRHRDGTQNDSAEGLAGLRITRVDVKQ